MRRSVFEHGAQANTDRERELGDRLAQAGEKLKWVGRHFRQGRLDSRPAAKLCEQALLEVETVVMDGLRHLTGPE